MSRQDVQDAVRRAREAIATYDREKRGIAGDAELAREARELIEIMKRAYMMGPSGTPCPTCGGSGRI